MNMLLSSKKTLLIALMASACSMPAHSQNTEGQSEPSWFASESEVSDKMYFEQLEGLDKRQGIIDQRIKYMESQEKYLELSAKLKKHQSQGNNVVIDENGNEISRPETFRDNPEYIEERALLMQRISELEERIKQTESIENETVIKNKVYEKAFSNLYLISTYGKKKDPVAEFFYQGGKISAPRGGMLPGDWVVQDINLSSVTVFNANLGEERFINLKDPAMVKQEIAVKQSMETAIALEKAKAEATAIANGTSSIQSGPVLDESEYQMPDGHGYK